MGYCYLSQFRAKSKMWWCCWWWWWWWWWWCHRQTV